MKKKIIWTLVLIPYVLIVSAFTLELIGFIRSLSQIGLHETICGAAGCSDSSTFPLTLAWLIILIMLLYVIPLLLFLRRLVKRNEH